MLSAQAEAAGQGNRLTTAGCPSVAQARCRYANAARLGLAYLNQYFTPRWWEQVPEKCFEYDQAPSLHLAITPLGCLMWVPQVPVVWWAQWTVAA